MRALRIFVVVAALPALAWMPCADAQGSRASASRSLAQAERVAIELKQGMTLEEVEKLLGKPNRTALRNPGNTQGTLHWTYSWSDASASKRYLQVAFGAKAPEQWTVNSWDWTDY